MQIFLVGGAVRDELLGLPVTERDWCVVGATPEQMQHDGYRPVGKDFPVFLHPESQEEYALARTERKTGVGYHGFSFNTSPDVSIEEDLGRRDLTINALAISESGQLIDPHGGKRDIELRQLRHVSGAFAEDPVRVLRTAKFAARFYNLGFKVAGETVTLMQQMVAAGEVNALVPDRVWKETEAALIQGNARVYFETLRMSGALGVVYPEIDALFGVPQPAKWHPEIDTGLHTMMTLEQAEKLSASLEVRFAALVHDLGKAMTDESRLPSHPGHELQSVRLIRKFAERLPVPKQCRDLALLVAEFHTHCHRALELRPATVLKVLERCDAFRRPERFEHFLLACEADARGRAGFELREYPQADFLRAAYSAASNVDNREILANYNGAAISKELSIRRQKAIAQLAGQRNA